MRLIPLLLISASVVASSLHAQVGSAGPRADAPSDRVTYEAYGLRLFRHLAEGRAASGANIFISPVSAGTAFSMALLGADGTTREVLARALGASPAADDALHRGNQRLAAALRSTDVTLEVATSLWGRRDLPFIPAFTQGAQRWYGAPVTPVDFHDAATARRINAWGAEATHGRIRQVVAEPMDTTLALVLANAVYFKGKWADAFDSAATRPQPFHGAHGAVQVPMMRRGIRSSVARMRGFRIARVPYRGGRFAMYLFLPDSGHAVGEVTAALAPESWSWRDLRWEGVELDLGLPRFAVRDTVDLVGPMRAMGVEIAFACPGADFTRAVPRAWLAANRRMACLSDAAQSTFVQVDEEGTEAAAVTALSMITSTGAIHRERFIVDHPFVTLIRDDRTGALLFIGLTQDPTR